MTVFKRTLWLFCLAVLTQSASFSSALFSQTLIEEFRPGARAVAFGGSLVAQARDPSAIFWNPALLGGLRDRAIVFSINEPFEFDFVGISQFIPLYGTIGGSLSRVFTVSGIVDRGTAAWGRKFSHRVSLGTNFNLAKLNEDWFASVSWGMFVGNPKAGTVDQRWRQPNHLPLMDRLNFGVTVQHLPLGDKLFEPAALFGLSYLFPKLGIVANSGYDIKRGDNISHLGVGVELYRDLTILAGIEKFDADRIGVGLGFTHDNFVFNLTYSRATEKLSFTMFARISPAPALLAKPFYKRGQESFRARDYKAASLSLRKYLSYDVQGAESDTARVIAKILEKKLVRDRGVVDSLLTAANKHLSQGEQLRAALILSRVLDLDADNLKARQKISTLKPVIDSFVKKSLADGIAEFDSRNFSAAKTSFSRVLLFEKRNETALNYLAQIELVLSDRAEEYFYRGVGLFRQKQYHQAREEFLEALKYNPNSREARSYLSRTNEKIEENREQVRALLKSGQELERRSQFIEATNQYLEVLKIDEENDEAKKRIAGVRPKVERLVQNKYNEGMRFYQEQNYIKAQESFSTVLSIDPEHSEAKTMLSKVRVDKKERAARYLAQADEARQKTQWKEALDLYSQVLNLEPQNERAAQGKNDAEVKLQIDAQLADGRAKLQEQKYLEAIAVFENILESDPKHAAAKSELAVAKRNLDEMVEKLFNEGISLYTSDRYQEAIERWNRALKLNPNHKGSLEYKQQAQERLKALEKLK